MLTGAQGLNLALTTSGPELITSQRPSILPSNVSIQTRPRVFSAVAD